MDFDPLVVLRRGDDIIWVAGAQHDTRSDGTGSFMVAQAYSAHSDFPMGTTFMDEIGIRWKLLDGVNEGFYMTGIILEEASNE